MANELTRTGIVGLELTREEVIELGCQVDAVLRKAQCREVNCEIIDNLKDISNCLRELDNDITNILNGEEC